MRAALRIRNSGATPYRFVVDELHNRQNALTVYGLVLLALILPALIGQLIDPRTLGGENVWVKPAKFLIAVAVFALTSAWFFGYVQPAQRSSPLLRITVVVLIAAGSFEISYIVLQAARGLPSHFNYSSTFHAVMYGLMGVGAVLLVGTTLPLAWKIARYPIAGLQSEYMFSVIVGLVLCFILGGGSGAYMGQQSGDSVGVIGGQLPLMGWNWNGGDLRIAHFLGIHAQQILPLLGVLMTKAPARLRWTGIASGSIFYVFLTVSLFVQAVR